MSSKKFYLFITFVVAFCSLSYELLIARTLGTLTGDIVTSQAWTIGFYIAALGFGAMTFSFWERGENSTRSLFYNTEVVLSFFGLLAVPLILLASMYLEYKAIFLGQPLYFILSAQAITFTVGYFSGFEIPLLLKLSQADEKNESNVIGVHYLGSMMGAVVAAYYFQPRLSAIEAGVLIAAINLILSGFFIERVLKPVLIYFVLVLVFVFGSVAALQMNMQQAQVSYFLTSPSMYAKTFGELLGMAKETVQVERHFSPYQTIDIVDKTAFELNGESDQKGESVGAPNLVQIERLYINSQMQVSLGHQTVYHEIFAHTPINLTGRVPKKILILGGGDGILAYELSRYSSGVADPAAEITLVELDPVILNLANHHPFFIAMNHYALSTGKVKVVTADAFSYMLKNNEKYDAIYADFPLPKDDELMRLYSLEFYRAVRRALSTEGFIVADTPGNGQSLLESRIADSLLSAGFENVYVYGGVTRFALASVQPLDLNRDGTREKLSDESKKYYQAPVQHKFTGSPISLFRPGARGE